MVSEDMIVDIASSSELVNQSHQATDLGADTVGLLDIALWFLRWAVIEAVLNAMCEKFRKIMYNGQWSKLTEHFFLSSTNHERRSSPETKHTGIPSGRRQISQAGLKDNLTITHRRIIK